MTLLKPSLQMPETFRVGQALEKLRPPSGDFVSFTEAEDCREQLAVNVNHQRNTSRTSNTELKAPVEITNENRTA